MMEEKFEVDLAAIEELAELSQMHGLTELTVETGGHLIQLLRHSDEAAEADHPDIQGFAVAHQMEIVPVGVPLPSPAMGVFYRSPSPGAPPFIKEGDMIEEGQIVGLIEAMKTYNEIKTPFGGRVTQVVAQDSQLVSPDETLMYVDCAEAD